MCKYKYLGHYGTYLCIREGYRDGFCIFHGDKENFTGEEKKEFEKEFRNEIERQRKEEKKFDFTGFKFPNKFSFKKYLEHLIEDGYLIEKPIRFCDAKFVDIDFSLINFKGYADFYGATFTEDANFSGATFTEDANFCCVTFKGKAEFGSVQLINGGKTSLFTPFKGNAYFINTTFAKDACFHFIIFAKNANFTLAKFKGEAGFAGTKFTEDANFSGAEFDKKAYFSNAKFRNGYFSETIFKENAQFPKATFINTFFSRAIFTQDADFRYVTSTQDADFTGAVFIQNASFWGATFHNSVKFIGVKNNKIFKSQADFSNSVFETPENVEFENVNLSEASFLNCRGIEKFRFINEIWNKKGERKAIYDEIALDKSEDKNYGLIGEVYRKLRINYEKNLRFSEAGDFYIGEMEMRRKYALANKKYTDYALIELYKLFSYYGENYLRPLLCMPLVIIFFAFIYTPIVSWNPFDFKPADIYGFWEYLERSILIFIQMPPADIKMNLLVAIERVSGVLFIALFILALRRKLKKGGE